MPTFGQCADAYIATHEGGWRNRKHRQHGRDLAPPRRADPRPPVDQVDTKAVLGVLEPIWTRARNRVTAESPHRGRAGRGAGRRSHRPRPAEPGAVEGMARPHAAVAEEARTTRPPHGACLTTSVPAFMAQLAEIDGHGGKGAGDRHPTACRTSEARHDVGRGRSRQGAWLIPAPHEDGQTPPGSSVGSGARHPARSARSAWRATRLCSLVVPAPALEHHMAMLLRRLGHGDSRSTASEARFAIGRPRSTRPNTRPPSDASPIHREQRGGGLRPERPARTSNRLMAKWADYVCGDDASNVVPLVRKA